MKQPSNCTINHNIISTFCFTDYVDCYAVSRSGCSSSSRRRRRIGGFNNNFLTPDKLFTHMPLSPSSVIWYWLDGEGGDALRWALWQVIAAFCLVYDLSHFYADYLDPEIRSIHITDVGIPLPSPYPGWLCGTMVEHRSLTGEVSLSCTRLQLAGDYLCE